MKFDLKKQELFCRIFQINFLLDGLLYLLISIAFFTENPIAEVIAKSPIPQIITYVLLFAVVIILILNRKIKFKKAIFYIAIYPLICLFIQQIYFMAMIFVKISGGEAMPERTEYVAWAKELIFTFPGAILCLAIGTIQVLLFFWSLIKTRNGVHTIKPPTPPIIDNKF